MSTAIDGELSADEWAKLVRWRDKFRADYAGSVYAVKAGDFIKIGFTKGDVADRMAQLQTGSPVALRLLGIGPGGRYIERGIHDILKSFKAHGEWFRDEPIVRNTVRQFCTTRAWI
jgi:hypothetical protein